ncbi:peptide-methionine (S)-S-oxide reductase [Paraoerskovia marina]|uniref:Peptide methionine sulfoxide reductase MsrA n=1 Tax=Paraoerskovia marina TaxID=545619 RepID=A0A1H1QLY0_9CELL|nr:peptide-methionine (S)-S-oxide reductase MsrA [Paraoerskovia marina]SDS24396.1 peptide-methionine (S)-S-oxide reductase [Paraoerskovia marina]
MFDALFGSSLRSTMVTADKALAGRSTPVTTPGTHTVLGTPLAGPWPEGTRVIYLALGCFWGAEKEFWQLPGVVTTAAGYQGGFTENPSYEEVCTSRTGHTETVMVAYDPAKISDAEILKAFWESHDPTQGYRQGNDVGTQYRSAVYWTTPEQEQVVRATHETFEKSLVERGFGRISTELKPAEEAGPFYYAENEHQQYLHKNPAGYCPVHSTGVACSIPA